MALLVTGASQALATAGLAAAVSGRTVLIGGESAAGALPSQVQHEGAAVAVDIRPLSADDTVDAIIVVAESRDLRRILDELAPHLDGTPVLLAPGGFAGALRVGSWCPTSRPAESTGFPVSGRVDGDTLILGVEKKHLPFAAADPAQTAELLELFSGWIPSLEASSVVTTSLANTNHIIHPPVTLLNAVRIDSAAPFTLYRDGISDAADNLLTAVDNERLALCRAVGADPRSGRDWMCGFYGDGGMEGETLVPCLASYPGFETTPGPGTLDYRYLVDDVPHGIAQWSALGRRLGVPTPHLDSLIALLEVIAPALDLAHDAEALELFLDHAGADSASVAQPA